MLRRMRGASDYFYSMAVRIGVHAFIEFTGLMNEFIKLCEEAHAAGIDFTMANVHGGQHLPFQPHHITYVYEKLECIYGEPFGTAAANPKSYMTPEHAVTAPSLPPTLLGGRPISAYSAAYAAPVGEPGAVSETCGADDSIPFEYTTIGQKCKNTKPCPVHDDNGNRRRPWNS